MKSLMIALIIIVLVVLVALAFIIFEKSTVTKEVHEHADFKVYLNGIPYNFSQEKYLSTEKSHLNNFIHMHDMDGDIIHKHASGMTMGDFFTSLKMKFNSTCFIIDSGDQYCNGGDKKIKMFVNGIASNKYENYEFADLDKILITYGDESSVSQQIKSVTDKACIQSGKCPEKGQPIDESSCSSQSICAAE